MEFISFIYLFLQYEYAEIIYRTQNENLLQINSS